MALALLVWVGMQEPKQHNEVTVFFSDIVGFTHISSVLKPSEVMEMLNRLYLTLDRLTNQYDLFKVETIGDACVPLPVTCMLDCCCRACLLLLLVDPLLAMTRWPPCRYMLVGNLHPKVEDHAARVARFAMDAIRESAKLRVHPDRPELGYIKMRAGFHTGPVVASVVGNLNPRCESSLLVVAVPGARN